MLQVSSFLIRLSSNMDEIQNLKQKGSSLHSDLNFWRQMYMGCSKEHPLHETYKFEFEKLKAQHKSVMKQLRRLEQNQHLHSV